MGVETLPRAVPSGATSSLGRRVVRTVLRVGCVGWAPAAAKPLDAPSATPDVPPRPHARWSNLYPVGRARAPLVEPVETIVSAERPVRRWPSCTSSVEPVRRRSSLSRPALTPRGKVSTGSTIEILFASPWHPRRSSSPRPLLDPCWSSPYAVGRACRDPHPRWSSPYAGGRACRDLSQAGGVPVPRESVCSPRGGRVVLVWQALLLVGGAQPGWLVSWVPWGVTSQVLPCWLVQI